ncbi:GAF and ANTAR domain-containing protein [Lapillicoccus jejuensis]|uniref:ANTAR domain-containing protein n=1 Tax=Lapillicoccus jejuensis TaxID=402171 RepID=A0A542DXK8_9MICO|nr:GAF and ANTAR domain-containing protein [Lapillicoccus jejuensis]TQJ07819.1 hypothetical protein FB458_0888 [Lapillicoccus jejuensis]
MVERSEVLLPLLRVLAADTGGGSASERLCRAAVRLLGARGGALSLGATEDRVVVAATSTTARRMEDLQDLLGEGPSFEAFAHRRRRDTLTSSVASVHVAFETAAYGLLGDVRVLAFPFPVDDARAVGTLTVYADPAPWSRTRLEVGTRTAALLGVVLLEQESFEEMLHGTPWQHRVLVHQATGVVMTTLHVPAAESLSLLRAHAVAEDVAVVTVARGVVEDGDTAWLGAPSPRPRPGSDGR